MYGLSYVDLAHHEIVRAQVGKEVLSLCLPCHRRVPAIVRSGSYELLVTDFN